MEKSPGKPRVTAKDIAADIRQELVTGTRGPGDQLTAARELAKHYGVTLVTVQNAYRELRDEGLVVSQQGRGTFVVDPAEQAPDDENRGGSAFMTLAAEISAMHETIRSLGDRLERLEQAVEGSGAPPAR
ncbi:GntR family transcriptional regulator [Streptomyces sp. Pv4-95]|uniref:GntR family transcriptional regulator n=1 Tax=Streptomyces sp. Pv4-95 TaxID=3049543 RepID=UPI003892097E